MCYSYWAGQILDVLCITGTNNLLSSNDGRSMIDSRQQTIFNPSLLFDDQWLILMYDGCGASEAWNILCYGVNFLKFSIWILKKKNS